MTDQTETVASDDPTGRAYKAARDAVATAMHVPVPERGLTSTVLLLGIQGMAAAGLLAAAPAGDNPRTPQVPRDDLITCIRGITANDVETRESFDRAHQLASDITDALADAGYRVLPPLWVTAPAAQPDDEAITRMAYSMYRDEWQQSMPRSGRPWFEEEWNTSRPRVVAEREKWEFRARAALAALRGKQQ